MKLDFFIIAIITIGLISSCNMGKNKNNDGVVAGTDSSMMSNSSTTPSPLITKIDTNNNANPNKSDAVNAKGASNMPPADVDTTNSKINAKINNAKKGKKGSIKIDVNAGSNKKEIEIVADKDGYYNNAEVLPSFPGGQKALENFFEKNIQYPTNAADNGIEGKVNIVFLIDERGKVSSPKLVSQHIGYGIETEAMRVFSKMPTWTAGKIKGKNVKTRYTLPINFRLD